MSAAFSGAAGKIFDTMLGARRHTADLFPLRRTAVRHCPSHGLCRGTVKRLRKNEAIFKRVDGVYCALNEMYGSGGSETVSSELSPAQEVV